MTVNVAQLLRCPLCDDILKPAIANYYKNGKFVSTRSDMAWCPKHGRVLDDSSTADFDRVETILLGGKVE